MSDGFQHYVRDVLYELLERARKAKAEARGGRPSADTTETAFAQGRAMAYYEVISHMMNQLDAFGLDRASVDIEAAYDPDRDLLWSGESCVA